MFRFLSSERDERLKIYLDYWGVNVPLNEEEKGSAMLPFSRL